MTKLVVTLLEEATVFEGADTVYRYDLVTPVLQEPWALGALVEQAQALCEGDRGQAEVRAEKQDEEVVAAVTQALHSAGLMGDAGAETGASAEQKEQKGCTPGAGRYGDPLDVLARPREVPRHRYADGTSEGAWWRTAWQRLTWWHAAMAGVVLAVAGLSWWSLGDGAAVGIAPQAGGEDEAASAVSAAEPREEEGEPREAESAVRPAVVHEVGAVRVSTPEGFRADLAEGVVILTGLDEDLRILVSADPLFSVPPGEVLREVAAEVGDDPTLSDLDPPEPPREEGQKMRYREEPGDGSRVQWSTWVESGHHMSVGCHTKGRPTVVQKASCRIAEESVGLR
ncbi:type VII secretion-associated protein [Corynebacterium mastitidis]|uniref:Type VII secretion-associated protein n=1 Tax=Corynebacterium mastitidis TaxID=161890 RepID=A0ABU8NX30_9CORY